MRVPDFPLRTFATDAEFMAALDAMDTVVVEPATVGGVPSLHYKGLRYAASRHEVSVVGKGYALEQHPDMLRELRGSLLDLGITPKGRIAETHRGVLHAQLHFFNPNYALQSMVTVLGSTTPCHLGVVVTSSHGAPAQCLTLEAMAETGDGTQYLVSDILGSRRVRHVGRLQASLKDLIREMTQNLPTLGQHLRDAKQTPLTVGQCTHALLALGHGPRVRRAIQARHPESAWSLYDALCRHARRSRIRSGTRLTELRSLQALLDPYRLDQLLQRGQQLELDEAATAEEGSRQATLEQVEAAA